VIGVAERVVGKPPSIFPLAPASLADRRLAPAACRRPRPERAGQPGLRRLGRARAERARPRRGLRAGNRVHDRSPGGARPLISAKAATRAGTEAPARVSLSV